MISIGSFVCYAEDVKKEDPAIVIYDHSIHGFSNSISIKYMKDGHLSLAKPKDLLELSPLEFCKSWCGEQMSYEGVKDEVE